MAGRQAIVTHPRGRLIGEHQDLDAAEQQAVRQAVLDHGPCGSGLAGQLWTRIGGGTRLGCLDRLQRVFSLSSQVEQQPGTGRPGHADEYGVVGRLLGRIHQ